MVAALAAAQNGAQVILLEKTEAPGGTTALSGGGIVAAGSRFQRRAGIKDHPARLVEEILSRNGYQSDAELTGSLVEPSTGLVDWLVDTIGTECELRDDQVSHSVRRLHHWGRGRDLVQYLLKAVELQRNISLVCSTSASSLILDPEGAVTGVATAGGVIPAKTVILATGGFAASHELLTRYIPEAADLPHGGHHGSTGDGLLMGLAAGGATENLGAFQPYPVYSPSLRSGLSANLLMLGGILVDERGERFSDETRFPGGAGSKMLGLPNKESYLIFDERVFQLMREQLENAGQTGVMHRAETTAGLASQLGINPQGLERTIERYSGAAPGSEDEFGRPMETPMHPAMYGTRVAVAIYHTQGGLKVNTNGQVLRSHGSVIGNLYAGGGAAAGMSGSSAEGYLPGNGLLAALGLGKVAGQHAAASTEIREREME